MFKINMQVRDYECDLQGIVNNAVYMNYLEHARHEFLLDNNVNFVELSQQGIDLVVVKAEIEFKKSLKPADKFYVTILAKLDGRVRMKFIQNIFLEDGTLIVSATITGVVTKNGRPIKPNLGFL
ncbi:MAG TPA: 4-hydroxybenzoyl-CoA thioesterase [Thiomicrospira sp.]|jgi:acyl-CoA thioester hydrolase|nr:4-hydroxybenzoyl-CoA thioesterase [Thiomicrospira sp.]